MTKDHCPACTSTKLTDFFVVENVPVDVGILLDNRDDARRAARGDITLAYCHTCGFAFNRTYDASKVVFEPGYEAYLVHSPIFRAFLDGVADRLLERFDLHGKTILEIGCGSGYFLELLCRRGNNHGIGIDPSIKQEGTEEVDGGTVRRIRDHYSDRYLDLDLDFICCQSVFEDFPEPGRLLADMRTAIGKRRIGVYFEVFNAFNAFHHRESWSINYEQCNYFGLQALAGLFRRNGFEVLEAKECYEGGQYIYVDAKPAENGACPAAVDRSCDEIPRELSEFGEHHRRSMSRWRERFARFAAEGKRVAVWGSGCKGINFLNAIDADGTVEYVVDINPDRQDRYIPCSAQRIIGPEFLAGHPPDVIIVTNAMYEREIRAQVASFGIDCEYLVA